VTSKQAIGHLEGKYPQETGKHKPHIYEQWQTGYNPRNGRAGLRVVRPGAYVGSFNSCRIEANKPSATIVKSHNHWHYSEFRQLQSIEASILASFGASFRWQDGFIERIGNSVPPLFMRAIALHVRREVLSGTSETCRRRTVELQRTMPPNPLAT
jgi:site-specific DNA-cytosine methylase